MKKGKLFSLLLVMVMAGTAFVPMSVNATTYPAAEDAQYYFSVDKGFTDDQLVQIKAALLAAGVPMDVVNQIQPAGAKTATVLIERVVPVTLGVTSNDVNSIVLADFDAEAPNVVIEGSVDTMETPFTGPTTVNNPIQLSGATADLQRDLASGGIAFENGLAAKARPSLTDSYDATVNYRGKEQVAGYSAFTATIGDLPIVEVITDVVTTVVGGGVAAAAGGGAGGAAAGGEGEAVIPDGETPLDDGAGAETTIPEGETPLDDGQTGDNGGTTTSAGMPWWVWVIIAAVVIAIVALIAVRRKNAAHEEN